MKHHHSHHCHCPHENKQVAVSGVECKQNLSLDYFGLDPSISDGPEVPTATTTSLTEANASSLSELLSRLTLRRVFLCVFSLESFRLRFCHSSFFLPQLFASSDLPLLLPLLPLFLCSLSSFLFCFGSASSFFYLSSQGHSHQVRLVEARNS